MGQKLGDFSLKLRMTSIVLLLFWSLAAESEPYFNLHANSEQKNPPYFGTSPYDALVLKQNPKASLVLPTHLKTLAEKALAPLRAQFDLPSQGEFDAWPSHGESGDLVWTFSRWRKGADHPWQWLKLSESKEARFFEKWGAHVPIAYPLHTKRNRDKVFLDFDKADDLYFKPAFGDCVFIEKTKGEILAAWLPPDRRRNYFEENQPNLKQQICLKHQMPPRFNLQDFVQWHFSWEEDEIIWPKNMIFSSEQRIAPPADLEKPEQTLAINLKQFKQWTKEIAGEVSARFPLSKHVTTFRRKNSFEKQNQLLDLVTYLEEHYEQWQIPFERLTFSWLGIPQANLLACLPGNHTEPPLILADHMDTAFGETHFDQTSDRVSVPGADDNALATAGLLAAAQVLSQAHVSSNICFLHLTGEEYPGDDLGARDFARMWLQNERPVRGIIVLDMFGYNATPKQERAKPIFQINSGKSRASYELSKFIYDIAVQRKLPVQPMLRDYADPKSYLYNTDAYIFSELGFPTLLINEHINLLENFARPHYHELSDTTKTIDWNYAKAILETVIEGLLLR